MSRVCLPATWFLLMIGWRGLSLAMLAVLAVFVVLALHRLRKTHENTCSQPVGTS